MSSKKRVVVGMSGGVDSSVAALLLKEQGYEVIAVFMKNWEDAQCSAEEDAIDVAHLCKKLAIPFYTFNFTKEYRQRVFAQFLEEYQKGWTPNPDILCNREIKFDLFLEKALSLFQADYIATGHYAKIDYHQNNFSLFKAADLTKDQSYFLYTLSSTQLQKVLFPLSDLKKTEVRALAKEAGLSTYDKKDSTGICFIGKRNFSSFLSQFIGYRPGKIITMDGKVVGTHQGCAYYTLGQRKGLKIGGQGEPWFVIEKRPQENLVVVAQGDDHPALYSSGLIAEDLSWVNSLAPSLPFSCLAKVRYRQEDQRCLIEKNENGHLFVSFETPQRAVTPGQSIVFYDGSRCLGGGFIRQAFPAGSLASAL